MSFSTDVEVAAAASAAAATAPATAPVAARGDVRAVRELTNAALAASDSREPDSPDVLHEDHRVPVAGGSTISVRWYTRAGSQPGSAVVYLHGGGMVAGSVALYDRHVARYVQATGVPFLSVDYRLAPGVRGTVPARDGFRALAWLIGRAQELGVDPLRIAVMGDSAGGGVAAGVAIAARDSGTSLAQPDPHLPDAG